MLFLLNTQIVELASPELRLLRRWRKIGCGDPTALRAQDAIGFVAQKVHEASRSHMVLDDSLARDLAALVVAKTGANCLQLRPAPNGQLEPRLRTVPLAVLETYRRGANAPSEFASRRRA